MNELTRRFLGYGSAGVVAAGLVWSGFLYRPPPDMGTLLSAIDTQLRLAYALPALNKDGQELSARAEMLDDVAVMIDQAEGLEPNTASIAEYRGFLCFLRGDYDGAANIYREARGLSECSRDLSDSLVFNEARMLRRAGKLEAALAAMDSSRGTLQAKYLNQADLERAALMVEMGRQDEAGRVALDVASRAPEDPLAAVRAGLVLEELQRTAEADAAYQAAAVHDPAANYYRSRLKIGHDDVDSAFDLLGLAVQAAPARVRKLVDRDGESWASVSAAARFQEIIRPEASATPGR